MNLLKMTHDCSDPANEPQLVEMTPEEETAHLANQAAITEHLVAVTAVAEQRAAALTALRLHAQANPGDPTALLAQALGLL